MEKNVLSPTVITILKWIVAVLTLIINNNTAALEKEVEILMNSKKG
jgi:hypothetical protein